tara:strand:+ start:200 stop:436 length:237 start_codon:yes stop_codon:yes gene_type:complete
MTIEHNVNLTIDKLSDQALGAIMMALQKSLLEQSDIVPVLKGFDFVRTEQGLIVRNPPIVRASHNNTEDAEESDEATE